MTPTEQAAKLAVEEMAEKLFWMGYAKTPMTLKTAIIEELSPLYAKLAEYAEVLGECREYVAMAKTERDRYASQLEAYPTLYTDAKRLRDESIELLNRIDALLGAKGGEDGEN